MFGLKPIKIGVIVDKYGVMPERKSIEASCYDLCSSGKEDKWIVNEKNTNEAMEYSGTIIKAGQTVVLKTNVRLNIPKPSFFKLFGLFKIGYHIEVQIRARSGLASRGLIPANGIGTIDSDYTGEVGVIVFNSTKKPFNIVYGERVAQLKPILCFDFELFKTEILRETDRGDGGFGSTGKH